MNEQHWIQILAGLGGIAGGVILLLAWWGVRDWWEKKR